MKRKTTATWPALILAGLLAGPWLSCSSQEPDPMTKRVARFVSTSRTPLEAILMLGRQEDIPIAIVCSDDALLTTDASVDEHDSDLASILASILRGAPTYSAIRDKNGVVMVADPSKLSSNPILSFSFSHFGSSHNLDVTDISERLWGELQMQLNPKRKGYGGVLRVQPWDRPLPPMNLDNVSVSDVLDWAITRHKSMAWVTWPPPNPLIDAPQFRLWNFVYYSSSDASTEKLCCIYLPKEMIGVPEQVRARIGN
jgi:hypothetical protein